MSLLQVTSSDGRDVLPPRRGCPKLGRHGKDCEVGTRVDGSGYFVRPSDDHQVPSPVRLRGRMDRDQNASSGRGLGVLDDVL